MMEYKGLLEEYASLGYVLYSRTIGEQEWGDTKVAQMYLEKYWLSEVEYNDIWKPIQNRIFVNQDIGLPEMVFTEDYNLLVLTGGVLFVEEDFLQLQECMRALGDSSFVVVENTFGGKLREPSFRMKYPVDISWTEMMSGNYISSVLFEMFHKEYFVFSPSADWGKYAANEYENPLDLVGFKPKVADVFKSTFRVAEDEQQEIMKWLPVGYKERLSRSQ